MQLFLLMQQFLIVAAAVFFKNGYNNVASIIDAHALLAPLLGTKASTNYFWNSTYSCRTILNNNRNICRSDRNGRICRFEDAPWLRRLTTRLIAIIPTVIVIKVSGDHAVDSLLILSQVILSLQLPFAIIPLLHFTSNRKKMGEFASRIWVMILAWTAASLITLLNLKYIYDLIIESMPLNNTQGMLVKYLLIPVSAFLLPLLLGC